MTTAAEDSQWFVSANGLGWSTPEGDEIISGIDLNLGYEKAGLIGPNGVGKTTLLRLLMGVLAPTRGAVRRNGRWGYLPQDAGAVSTDTVAASLGVEQKIAALSRIEAGSCAPEDFDILGEDWKIVDRTNAALTELGLDYVTLDRTLDTLSGGERTRVALGRLLLDSPDLLILDEPTNNLDEATRTALYRTVESWRGAIVIVTHDRELLRRVNRILRLGKHGLDSYGGNYDDYLVQSMAEEDAATRRLKDAKREVERVRRQVQESRDKHQKREAGGRRMRSTGSQSKLFYNAQRERSTQSSAGLTNQAERMFAAAKDELSRSRENVEEYQRISVPLNSSPVAASKITVSVEDVSYRFAGTGDPSLSNVNLQLVGAERVAISGANGSGKTTLLRLISGDLQPSAGRIMCGVEHVTYLDQIDRNLLPGDTVLESFLRYNPGVAEGQARQCLAHFLFFGDAVFRKVNVLSGGERVRAGLACVLMRKPPPQLLLLDEPTNHLDLDAVKSIESALRSYMGALIVVSHDSDFLRNIGVDREFLMPERVQPSKNP